MSNQIDQNDPHKIQKVISNCINNVSQNPNYQHKLTIFFTLAALTTTMQIYGNGLLYMNPVFRCNGNEAKVLEDEACSQLQFCSIINTGTITAELNLYCDSRKKERVLIQSGGGIGSWIALIYVLFSDRIGKKFSYCATIILLNLTWASQFIGAHMHNIPLLLIAQILCGLLNKINYVSFIVLLTRFMKKEAFEKSTIIWFIAYHGISQICIAGINFQFDNWRPVAYFYSGGILICSIVSVFIVKEDPVFLFHMEKTQQVKKIIEEVGQQNDEYSQLIKQNQLKIDQLANVIDRIRIQNGFNPQSSHSFGQILRLDIVEKIIIIGLTGCFYQMASRSVDLSIQSLQYSYSFNLFIVGIGNTCGFASAIYIIQVEQQRKRGYIYTSVIYFLVAILFIFPFCKQNGNVQTCVIFFLRFFLCWGCNFYTRLKVDSFPAKYQMTIIAVVEVIVNTGLTICPTLVQLSLDHGLNAIVVIAFLRLLFGTLPVYFLNQEKSHLYPNEKSKENVENDEQVIDIFD